MLLLCVDGQARGCQLLRAVFVLDVIDHNLPFQHEGQQKNTLDSVVLGFGDQRIRVPSLDDDLRPALVLDEIDVARYPEEFARGLLGLSTRD